MKLKNQITLYPLKGKNKTCMLMKKHYDAVRQCVDLIESFQTLEFESVILYGSCSRSEAKFSSDIDLCVVTPTDTTLARIIEFKKYMYENLPDSIEVDVKFLSREKYLPDTSLFIKDIRKDGVILCQNTFREI